MAVAEQTQTIFRKKTLDRIASPEQLDDYLRVANPGIWVILVAVILLLAGLFSWSAIGTLETKADATVVVQDHTAVIAVSGGEELSSGMPLRIDEKEYAITSTKKDEYGRTVGQAEIDLPDGTYEGVVVVEETHPIDFLLTSR